MTQPSLFDPAGRKHKPHSMQSTSLDAHKDTQQKKATLQSLVLKAIRASGPYGMTDDEIQSFLGLIVQTEVPRRHELVQQGLIKNSGRRRRTRAGSSAIVWMAA